MESLQDRGAERAVLAGIAQNGDTYADVETILQTTTFTDEINQIVHRGIKHIREDEINARIDLALLFSTIRQLGYDDIIVDNNNRKYIKQLLDFHVEPSNVRKFAARIRKYEVARLLHQQLGLAQDDVANINGSERIDAIIGLAENRIFDFSSLLMDSEDSSGYVHISEGASEYYDYLVDNPRDLIGISTGYPHYDMMLGGGLQRKAVSVIAARTGEGKCLGKNTPVLMFDGRIKFVQNVVVGDLVMGPDSRPRTVLEVSQGYGSLYKVTPVKGDSYVVNQNHILSLQHTISHNIVNISVKEYLNKNTKFKHEHKGYRVAVDWPKKEVPIPAYILGIWLGDGCSTNTQMTSMDTEMATAYAEYANQLDLNFITLLQAKGLARTYAISVNKGSRTINPFLIGLRNLNLLKNKHIPDIYLTNDEQTRLELLAGFIDADGHLENGCYDTITKFPILAENILYLARSLGFAAYSTLKECYCQTGGGGVYTRICISGDLSRVPTRLHRKQAQPRLQKKNVLRTGITVEPIGEGDYYGFQLDKDHLFLLGDFTVTHNSLISDNMSLHIAGNIGIPILYLDTEMDQQGHWFRLWANKSGVPMDKIKTGKAGKNDYDDARVRTAIQYVNGIPYYYCNIAGRPFEEIVAYMRRWVVKEVGKDENGKTKDCAIFYDYLKLMSAEGLSSDMKEYQMLGFQMTSLHNFAVKHDLPIGTFIQLNKDGITKEGLEGISQSDRISWLASSVAIFKRKSDDEMAATSKYGNRKLIVVKSRHGTSHGYNEYINMKFEGAIARITEGDQSTQLSVSTQPTKEQGSNELRETPQMDDEGEAVIF